VYSALEADFSALMRYINSRFTYLLTYTLPYHLQRITNNPQSARRLPAPQIRPDKSAAVRDRIVGQILALCHSTP